MTDLCVVHLVWAPLGPEPLRRFVESYRRHDAGAEHALVVLLNGFARGDELSEWERALDGVRYEPLRLDAAMLDLAAYREAVRRFAAKRYCFVNSHSVVLADGWLDVIDRHLRAGAGIVGTAGSYESARSSAPRPLRPFRRGFPPFPNPHIRTNGFALAAATLARLDWPAPTRKLEAWMLESGSRGITHQLLAAGGTAVVAGRDGVAYPPQRWRESATFRSGEQANQLIDDNRTREYREASPARRRELERMAWGDQRDVSMPSWVAPANRVSAR